MFKYPNYFDFDIFVDRFLAVPPSAFATLLRGQGRGKEGTAEHRSNTHWKEFNVLGFFRKVIFKKALPVDRVATKNPVRGCYSPVGQAATGLWVELFGPDLGLFALALRYGALIQKPLRLGQG